MQHMTVPIQYSDDGTDSETINVSSIFTIIFFMIKYCNGDIRIQSKQNKAKQKQNNQKQNKTKRKLTCTKKQNKGTERMRTRKEQK